MKNTIKSRFSNIFKYPILSKMMISINSNYYTNIDFFQFKEFNHISTTIIVFASLQNVCHSMSLTPSKAMSRQSNHDFKEKYPYIQAGTHVPKISSPKTFFCRTPAF